MDGKCIVLDDVAHAHVGDILCGCLHVCDCGGDPEPPVLKYLVAPLLGLELMYVVSNLGECPKLIPMIYYQSPHLCPDLGGGVLTPHV